MRVHSIPATLTVSLFLLSAAPSRPPHAEVYVDIAAGSQIVDVIVGNRGELVSHDNFDVVMQTDRKGKMVCRAMTNFVTPIGPGESIRALRLQMVSGQSGATEPYTIRASIQPWDPTRGGVEKRAVVELPPGSALCIALKPVQ